MGLDLTFYEIKKEDKKNKNDKEKKYIEEVLYLSNASGMLIVNWLYRNDNAKLTGNYLKLCDIYHHIYGHMLEQIYKGLKTIGEDILIGLKADIIEYFNHQQYLKNFKKQLSQRRHEMNPWLTDHHSK